MSFGFDDYFCQEEFIFPESGGVTGMVTVDCPWCTASWEIEPSDDTDDRRRCGACDRVFVINWPARIVSRS